MRMVNLDTAAGWRLGAVTGELAVDLNRAVQLTLQPDGPTAEATRYEARHRMPADIREWLASPAVERLNQAGMALGQAEALLAERGADWARGRQLAYPVVSAVLAPPVSPTATVLALGLSYQSHAAEAGMEVPKYPLIFAKLPATLQGHRAAVAIPKASRRIDYEGELAVVIGRTAKEIEEAEALDYVAGYTIANDVSARDWQFRTSELMIGKAFDGFCPLGPWLVTSDEVADPHALQLQTRVNGELRQDASTAEMLFPIPFVIAYLSQALTLRPGDVILTGTPAGIGATRQPRLWLKPGDVVEVSIAGIGTLVTPMESAEGGRQ